MAYTQVSPRGAVADGITWEEVTARRTNRSKLNLWWNQSDLNGEAGAVSVLIQQFERIANTMYTDKFSRQLYSIFLLEEMFMAMPQSQMRFVEDVMICVSTEIEKVLGPCPDDMTLKAFSTSFIALQQNNFGKKYTLHELGKHQRGMAVLDEAAVVDNDIKSQAVQEIDKMRIAFAKWPLLHWFLGTLKTVVSKGDYKVLEVGWCSDNLFIDMCMSKTHMRWSTLGWVYIHLVEQDVHTDVALGTVKRRDFQALVVKTIPQASIQLATLYSILQDQQKVNETLKNKMLAAFSVGTFYAMELMKRQIVKHVFPEVDAETD